MLRVTDKIALEDWEMTEQFIRASGPGGQNVNKVATAVELRFEAARSPNLPDAVKARLRRIAGKASLPTPPDLGTHVTNNDVFGCPGVRAIFPQALTDTLTVQSHNLPAKYQYKHCCRE